TISVMEQQLYQIIKPQINDSETNVLGDKMQPLFNIVQQARGSFFNVWLNFMERFTAFKEITSKDTQYEENSNEHKRCEELLSQVRAIFEAHQNDKTLFGKILGACGEEMLNDRKSKFLKIFGDK